MVQEKNAILLQNDAIVNVLAHTSVASTNHFVVTKSVNLVKHETPIRVDVKARV